MLRINLYKRTGWKPTVERLLLSTYYKDLFIADYYFNTADSVKQYHTHAYRVVTVKHAIYCKVTTG